MLATASFVFSMDFLVGFGYGNFSAESELKGTTYDSSDTKDIHFKTGVEFDTSRVLITVDEPDLKKGEDLKVTSLSWQAVDRPDKFIKGFFGLSLAEFDYSNSIIGVGDKKNAWGLELGIALLEEGDIYEHIEMEFGYRYFSTKGLSNSDGGFELNDFSSYYAGFNLKF